MSDRRERIEAELRRQQQGPELPHFGDWRDLLRGLRGPTGEPGARGSSGAPGRTGDTGATGPTGLDAMLNTVFGTLTWEGVGPALAAMAQPAPISTAWGSANRAIFVPVRITERITIQKIAWLNGATLSGNVDVGLYDASGNRIFNVGSTAQAGVSQRQVVTAPANDIVPGRYYLAQAIDNTTATVFLCASLTLEFVASLGVFEMAAAFPLPATATFTVLSLSRIPVLFAALTSTFF
jgi:hypothetical protein